MQVQGILIKEPSVKLAFYKGPPKWDDLEHVFSHYAIRLRTWSKYSHAELVIDGICYSSSVRDGGVRKKAINLDSGHWDVVEIDPNRVNMQYAMQFFNQHEGAEYDWMNIVRFIIPFVKQEENKFVCFEFVSRMLNHSGSYRIDADDLYDWALWNRKQE